MSETISTAGGFIRSTDEECNGVGRAWAALDRPAAKLQTQMALASDIQEGGTHYKDMGLQPWDVVDTWPVEQQIGYYRGGALKYIMRMGSKDESVQEVKKGQHYMRKLLEVLEAQGDAE